MICWKCKHEMPDGLRYCGNCGVRMNRVAYVFEWLISKKGLPVLLLILALIIGCAAWGIVSKLSVPEIDLDMGWYTPGDENIVYKDEHESYGYVNNMILIFFTKDATPEQINEVIESVDGEVVGVMAGVNQYQVQVKTQTEEELEQMRKDLMQFDVVKNAVVDYVTTVEGSTAAVPNDPWDGTSSTGWDEANPSGSNWWVEAAHIVSAWDYESYFSHVDVGIVDNGYDTTHEDLQMVILNSDVANSEDHGTHVAGIIGATANNGMGISGVLRDVTMYCVDCYATEAQSAQKVAVSSLLAGIDTCIYNGCRVVNMSSGLIYTYAAGNSAGVKQTANQAVTYLVMMIDAYDEEFIVVQSAGNGDSNGNGVDALRYNGYFSSIDRQLVQQVLDEMKADGVKLEKNITADDVMNALMIVGAVDMERSGNGDYQLSKFSNYGEAITVCAPGVAVLSTVPTGNQYAYFNGTSMAAPVVAGVTAMVWSVDPTMSAGEVKDIIVSTATEPVAARTGGDYGIYYMVNASAAVEKAIGILEAKATEPTETEPVIVDPIDPTDPSEPVGELPDGTLTGITVMDNGNLYMQGDWTYDDKCNPATYEVTYYNVDGSVSFTHVVDYTYNDAGYMTSQKVVSDGEVIQKTVYTYDDDNRLIRTEYQQLNGDQNNYTIVYGYNAEGQRISYEGCYNYVGYSQETHASNTYENGLLVEQNITHDYEPKMNYADTERRVYFYDEEGRVSLVTRYTTYGNSDGPTYKFKYSYDHYPFTQENTNSENDGTYLYIYDVNGMLIYSLLLGDPNPVFEANSVGYLASAADSVNGKTYYFTYSGLEGEDAGGSDDGGSNEDSGNADYTFGYAGQTWDATMGKSGYTGFYTDDQLIATVDDNGVVTACAAGTTQIHARLAGVECTWTVRVNTVPFEDEEYYRMLSMLSSYENSHTNGTHSADEYAGRTAYEDVIGNLAVEESSEIYQLQSGTNYSCTYQVTNADWYSEITFYYYNYRGDLVMEETFYEIKEGKRSTSGYIYSPFIADDRENEVRLVKWYDEHFFVFPNRSESAEYEFLFFDAEVPTYFDCRVLKVVWPAGSK